MDKQRLTEVLHRRAALCERGAKLTKQRRTLLERLCTSEPSAVFNFSIFTFRFCTG